MFFHSINALRHQWAVLTAIAIPVFNGSLIKSKEAADMANTRAAYADAVTKVLGGELSSYPASKSYVNGFGTLNYPSKLSWTGGTTLSVTYTATKNDSLSLKADALG